MVLAAFKRCKSHHDCSVKCGRWHWTDACVSICGECDRYIMPANTEDRAPPRRTRSEYVGDSGHHSSPLCLTPTSPARPTTHQPATPDTAYDQQSTLSLDYFCHGLRRDFRHPRRTHPCTAAILRLVQFWSDHAVRRSRVGCVVCVGAGGTPLSPVEGD